MNVGNHNRPMLVEPGVKYFLNETLKQCNIYRTYFHNYIFNICIFIGFIFVLAIILFSKYKGKLTKREIELKNIEKQKYILEKIKNFQEAKKEAHQQLITGLPNWDSEYDIINNKIKY